MQFAFRLALVDEIELAAEVLLHVREAGVFRQDEARERALRFGLIGASLLSLKLCYEDAADSPTVPAACYVHAGLYEQAQKELRWFLLGRQYEVEPVRLLHAILSKYSSAVEAYNDSRLVKFFLRQLKHVVAQVVGKDGAAADADGARGSSPVVSRKGKGRAVEPAAADEDGDADAADAQDEDEEEARRAGAFKPTKLSPVLFLTYGHMLLTSTSYQNAISASPSLVIVVGAVLLLLQRTDLVAHCSSQSTTCAPTPSTRISRSSSSRSPSPTCSAPCRARQTTASTRSCRCVDRSWPVCHSSPMSSATDLSHPNLAQAFAFLDEYSKLRGECAETQYNLARAFHHIGACSSSLAPRPPTCTS